MKGIISVWLLALPALASASFTDDFSSYADSTCLADGAVLGPWTSVFNGYGCTKAESSGSERWLHQSPFASASALETHASLVLGPSFSGPLRFSAKAMTAAQLRTNAAPNPWEVAWLAWNYSDSEHFYYFIAGTKGWELGKRDPAYPGGQRFLATGTSPIFPIGRWYAIDIVQDSANKITVSVDGQAVAAFTDQERPYTSGKIGLYNEDAHVHFDGVAASLLSEAPPPVSAACATSAGTWRNVSIAPQTGGFTAEFDATPGKAGMDGVVGLSNGSAGGYAGLAAIARFNTSGLIDVRNGGAYTAAKAVPYAPGTTYRFRMQVSIPSRTYGVTVRSETAPEVTLGENLAFRTEQAAVSALNNFAFYASAGSEQVCSPAIAPDSTAPVITAISASLVSSTGASVQWATNEASDSQVEYGPSTAYGLLTPLDAALVASHKASLTGLAPGTLHYRVRSRDAAGNLALSADQTFVVPAPPPPAPTALFADYFNRPNGLITNEYAYWNPTDPKSVISPDWETGSGSFFVNGNAGWTGTPDAIAPNPTSSNGTHSNIFRLTTRRADFNNVEVSFTLYNKGLTSTSETPAVAWDGVHIFLRYQGEASLYYASINRRDNKVIIKKKVPGGPSNGGTYYNLSATKPYTVPYNTWQTVKATIKTNADGSVSIALYSGGKLLVSAIDNGSVGGAPIRAAGKVGLRTDNANVKIDGFVVAAPATTGTADTDPPADPAPPIAETPAPEAAPLDSHDKAAIKFLSPLRPDGINDKATFGAAAAEVTVFDVKGRQVFHESKQGANPIVWRCRDEAGRVVESGVYIARIKRNDSAVVYQSFAVAK